MCQQYSLVSQARSAAPSLPLLMCRNYKRYMPIPSRIFTRGSVHKPTWMSVHKISSNAHKKKIKKLLFPFVFITLFFWLGPNHHQMADLTQQSHKAHTLWTETTHFYPPVLAQLNQSTSFGGPAQAARLKPQSQSPYFTLSTSRPPARALSYLPSLSRACS